MKIQIPVEQFSRAIRSVKMAVSHDNSRPILKLINIRVFKDKITFFACDGFRALRYVIPNNNDYSEETDYVSFCIVPLQVNIKKYKLETVDIEVVDDKVLVSIPTDYGKVVHYVNQFASYDINQDKILEIVKEDIAGKSFVNPAYLARAGSAFSDARHIAMIVPKNPNNPVRLKATVVQNEALEGVILPVRVSNEEMIE